MPVKTIDLAIEKILIVAERKHNLPLRHFYDRLQKIANDGFFSWRPACLKEQIFPLDNLEDVDLENILKWLESYNVIQKEEIEGKIFGRIVN
jgi:hypothetical protein